MRMPLNTFMLRPNAEGEVLQDRHVAIVDDVLTTGTTVAVIAKTLRQAGVKRVDIWSATRAKGVKRERPDLTHVTDAATVP